VLVILLPRDRVRQRGWRRALLAAVLAVVGHVFIGLLLVFLSNVTLHLPPPPHPPRKPGNSAVVLRGLSNDSWAKNRGEAPKVKEDRTVAVKKKEETPKPKPEESPKGQIVDVAKGNGEVDPNAKYIAESSNKVARETKAKEQTAFYKNAAPRRTSPTPEKADGHDPVERAQRSGNDGLGQDDRPLKESAQKLALEVPDIKHRSEVAMKMPDREGPGAAISNRTESEAVKGNSLRFNVQIGQAGEDGSEGRAGKAGALNLLPSPAVLDKVSGAAANDHLEADEGDGTFLNTREWKYASFFNRVKQSVGQQWHPQDQLRLRDPTFQVYGARDRYTLVQVTLTDQGHLKDVFVEKSSGLDFLDLEAVKAFERAQPFPNPPPGLLAADQTVHFQFGFFLEMSGRPGLQLFRSAD